MKYEFKPLVWSHGKNGESHGMERKRGEKVNA
jgi:hypothetical protein